MVTGAANVYYHIAQHYNHFVVNRANGEYVKDGFHTNEVENFWSVLKRGIFGIYHQVSPKHLQRYLIEFAGRYNTRQIKDNERFELSVRNSVRQGKIQPANRENGAIFEIRVAASIFILNSFKNGRRTGQSTPK